MRGADPTKKNFELLQNKKKHNIQITFEFFQNCNNTLYTIIPFDTTVLVHLLS